MKKTIPILMIFIIIFNIICSIYIPVSEAALSSSYTQTLKTGIDAFPESYKKGLRELQELFSNWTFKAYETGIDWSELTSSSAENACMKNTIYKTGLMDPNMLCICGRTGDAGYYCASAKTVNYYLDPRNFLTQKSIFQFLDLSNSVTISKEIIENIVKGTYLTSYVDTIIEAANGSGVSPIHIIVTIYQELGKKAEIPKAISGTVEGYENLYNFYNYGATDGAGAVERGLEKAREMGWTTPEFALIDGAIKVLKGGYISKGQITKYFYKFDVVGDTILQDNETKDYPSNLFYSHQYMTNIQDPSSQAGMLVEYYTNNGLLDSHLTFVIPVYKNMPETKVSFPTELTEADGQLYYVDTTHVTSLNVRDEAGNLTGKLTKGQIVAVQSIENDIAYLKLKVATNRAIDETTGKAKWNFEDKYVYLRQASEYLVKCDTTIPDVVPPEDTTPEVVPPEDTTPGDTTPEIIPPEENLPIIHDEFKVEETNLKMIPSVDTNKIKEKYPNAIIKKADGTDITETNNLIGTGYKIIINGIEYTAAKLGDPSGDGIINSADLLKIVKHLKETAVLKNEYLTAADCTGDNIINSADLLRIVKYLKGTAKITL